MIKLLIISSLIELKAKLLRLIKKKINKKFNEILSSFSRQALHAKSLGFIHPTKKKFVNFDSRLPNDFKKMLDFLDNFAN